MERFQFLPTCCFYPTSVLMVDDNPDLLKDISFALMSGRHKYKSIYSTAPQEIINILAKQGNTIEKFVKKYVSSSEEYFDPSKTIVNIDVQAIHHEIYEKLPRFAQHIILIVDYAMPDMNGLELCQKIRRTLNLPIKILMLTGEADQVTAIEAFNDKLIDRFIVKSSPDYIKKLLNYLHDLHTEYFEEISGSTIESSPINQSILRKDPAFIEFFNNLAHQYHAVEYYMLDEAGSFLFLDVNRRVTRLVVKTEEEMQCLSDLACDDHDVSLPVVEALKKRQKLVYFTDEKEKILPANQWHLLDAKPLPSNGTGYYAIIEGLKEYPIAMKTPVSYREFLNSSS